MTFVLSENFALTISSIRFKKTIVKASPSVTFNAGTAVMIKGDDVVLFGCEIENYRQGIAVVGANAALVKNTACGNSIDIKGPAQGVLTKRDLAISLAEAGGQECTFSCAGQQMTTTTTVGQSTTTTQDPVTTTSNKQGKDDDTQGGIISSITRMLFG